MSELSTTIPALPVVEIAAAVDFYRDRLGFRPLHVDRTFAVLRRDAAELHLWAARDPDWATRERARDETPIVTGAETFLAGTASCRIECRGLDELFEEFRQAGVLYAEDTVIRVQPWGERDFPTLDLHGNLLTFFESTAAE